VVLFLSICAALCLVTHWLVKSYGLAVLAAYVACLIALHAVAACKYGASALIPTLESTIFVAMYALPIGVVAGIPFLIFRRVRARIDSSKQLEPCCTTCGYCLIGNVSGICPECGTPLTEAERAAVATGGARME
jgi:hypothetical protein